MTELGNRTEGEEKQVTRLDWFETRGFVLLHSVTIKNLSDKNPSESVFLTTS